MLSCSGNAITMIETKIFSQGVWRQWGRLPAPPTADIIWTTHGPRPLKSNCRKASAHLRCNMCLDNTQPLAPKKQLPQRSPHHRCNSNQALRWPNQMQPTPCMRLCTTVKLLSTSSKQINPSPQHTDHKSHTEQPATSSMQSGTKPDVVLTHYGGDPVHDKQAPIIPKSGHTAPLYPIH